MAEILWTVTILHRTKSNFCPQKYRSVRSRLLVLNEALNHLSAYSVSVKFIQTIWLEIWMMPCNNWFIQFKIGILLIQRQFFYKSILITCSTQNACIKFRKTHLCFEFLCCSNFNPKRMILFVFFLFSYISFSLTFLVFYIILVLEKKFGTY